MGRSRLIHNDKTVWIHLDPAAVRHGIRAYERDAPTVEAARLAGCSTSGMHRILVKLGINRPGKEAQAIRAGTVDQQDRAVSLYRRGMSAAEVAVVLGECRGTVSSWLAKHDARRSKSEAQLVSRNGRRAKRRLLEACRMRAAGVPRDEVAKALGVCPAMVTRYTASPDNPYRNAA